jgi:hypothetical protein
MTIKYIIIYVKLVEKIKLRFKEKERAPVLLYKPGMSKRVARSLSQVGVIAKGLMIIWTEIMLFKHFTT